MVRKKEEYAKPHTKGKGVGRIGLTTVAVTQDLLSGMPLVLYKNNSSVFGTVYYLNQDNLVPTAQTHTTHCIQEDQAYSKPVV